MAAYYKLMVESAVFLGADKQEAESQMLQVLNFETQLANVSILQYEEEEDNNNNCIIFSASCRLK